MFFRVVSLKLTLGEPEKSPMAYHGVYLNQIYSEEERYGRSTPEPLTPGQVYSLQVGLGLQGLGF